MFPAVEQQTRRESPPRARHHPMGNVGKPGQLPMYHLEETDQVSGFRVLRARKEESGY